MINAPPPVVFECVSEVVPICVLYTVGVQLTKNINKAPGYGFFEGISRIDVEVNIFYSPVRMVDIDRLGRHIQISGPDGGLEGIQVLLEIFANAAEPCELEGVFV